jgi:hypothetical protein
MSVHLKFSRDITSCGAVQFRPSILMPEVRCSLTCDEGEQANHQAPKVRKPSSIFLHCRLQKRRFSETIDKKNLASILLY